VLGSSTSLPSRFHTHQQSRWIVLTRVTQASNQLIDVPLESIACRDTNGHATDNWTIPPQTLSTLSAKCSLERR